MLLITVLPLVFSIFTLRPAISCLHVSDIVTFKIFSLDNNFFAAGFDLKLGLMLNLLLLQLGGHWMDSCGRNLYIMWHISSSPQVSCTNPFPKPYWYFVFLI